MTEDDEGTANDQSRSLREAAGDPMVDRSLEQVRRYAALSGPFSPVAALRSIEQLGDLDPGQLTAVAAGLSQVCDKTTGGDVEKWLMRGAERRWTLDTLARQAQVEDAVAGRRETADDGATRDLLSAIAGEGIFSAAGVHTALSGEQDQATLERLAVGLERAGSLAPQHEEIHAVKATLTHLDILKSIDAVQSRGFFGRDLELAQITRWLENPSAGGGSSALYIEGMPGVGKSTLLDEAASGLVSRADEWIVVRFDFDRAGLDVQDQPGLTMELARQVAAQVPGAERVLLEARQKAASTPFGSTSLKGERQEAVPEDLGWALARALASPRRILLLLDTLEVLRGRGETHTGRLFDWIAQLAAFGPISITVVGAGRGNALDSAESRVGDHLDLAGLDDASSDRLLESLGVEPSSFEAIRGVTKGNPLALRLAAKIVLERGPDELARAVPRGGMATAYLYRFVLSRIDDPDLRRLANPGLVVRRVSAEVIREVLGPQLGLRGLSATRAEALFQSLSSQHWLVEPDPLAVGFVRHRSDMRAVLLPLLYQSAPARSARIDRSAAKWFAGRPEPWCAVESAYHRLQLMRRDSAVPRIDPSVLAQLDAIAIAELPTQAQDVVLLSQGERSTSFRGDGVERGSPLDPKAARELRSMNEKADWFEGNYVYDRSFKDSSFDPKSRSADAALTLLWRSGRWGEARRLLGDQGGWDRAEPDLRTMLTEARLDATCRLEMAAEFDFDATARILDEQQELGMRAADLAEEGTSAGLAGGALRLAVHRARVPIRSRFTGSDAAGAAIELWRSNLPEHGRSIDAPAGPRSEGAAGWGRISARIGPVDVTDADSNVLIARSLAVLTPFADLTATMSRLPGHQYLVDFANAVRQRINEQGGLAPHRSPPWRDFAETPSSLALQSITELGLLAELIGAAAYVQRDRDLNLVAQSAERWRRTIAGKWSYGRASRREWDRVVDVSITDRIEALQADADPISRSLAQLEAWSPEPSREGTVLAMLRTRAPRTIESAERNVAAGGALGAAAVLLGRGIPSAFVPGIAILLSPQPSGWPRS